MPTSLDIPAGGKVAGEGGLHLLVDDRQRLGGLGGGFLEPADAWEGGGGQPLVEGVEGGAVDLGPLGQSRGLVVGHPPDHGDAPGHAGEAVVAHMGSAD